MKARFCVGVAMAALLPAPLLAQVTPPSPAPATVAAAAGPEADEIVVTGIRASLSSAQAIKRNADTIVDSIVAEDIGKLPDVNVTEALQRIPGIQVARDVGEGGAVAIRGLPQIETTINGRDAFTGTSRRFNLQDLPAELLARLDVYKSPTADLIEGGVGGTVDIRTRRPLDFPGQVISGSVRGDYADLVGKVKPLASLLYSNRFDTGIGEVGILLSGAYQERAYRQDLDSIGAPAQRADLIPGRSISAPNGSYQPLIIGDRQRIGLNGVLQWKPTDTLDLYFEGNYSRFKTKQDQYGVNIQTNANKTPIAGSVTTFPGTNDFQSGSYANQPFYSFGTARDTLDVNKTFAVGGTWTKDRLKISADLSYDKSKSLLDYRELDLNGVAPVFTQNLGGSVPSGVLTGIDTTNLANFKVGNLTNSINRSTGDQKAGRIDATYTMDEGFFSAFSVGARYADRSAVFTPIRFFSAPVNNSTANAAQFFKQNEHNDFFSKTDSGVPFVRDYLVADTDALRNNFDGIRSALGITSAPTVTPLGIFDISEKTLAGYAIAKYRFDIGIPIDGNIGVRVVQTKGSLVGNQPTYVPVTGAGGTVTLVQSGFAAINNKSNTTDVLPSFNLRARLTDQLQLRLAASKVLSRPDFSQLSPSLTLVPAQNAGSTGNPNLKPLSAKQLDASLEYYFSKTGSVYGAAFYKKVKGFVFQDITPGVVIDGVTYNLTTPTNSGTGEIKGAEIGTNLFFDFLPGAFSGLGVQANYTFVDSSAPTSISGLNAPLASLSKHSYNISGIYEKFGISARVAYNWRSKFYESIFAGVPATATTAAIARGPVFRKAYGWLDASLNYDVTPQITLSLEGSNLLRTKRSSYFTIETRPNDVTIDDRQILAGVRFKF